MPTGRRLLGTMALDPEKVDQAVDEHEFAIPPLSHLQHHANQVLEDAMRDTRDAAGFTGFHPAEYYYDMPEYRGMLTSEGFFPCRVRDGRHLMNQAGD